jgi:hypothetical protein
MKEAICWPRDWHSKYEAENEMNPSIFREYDIRGLAEQDFDENSRCFGKVHGTIIAERAANG